MGSTEYIGSAELGEAREVARSSSEASRFSVHGSKVERSKSPTGTTESSIHGNTIRTFAPEPVCSSTTVLQCSTTACLYEQKHRPDRNSKRLFLRVGSALRSVNILGGNPFTAV